MTMRDQVVRKELSWHIAASCESGACVQVAAAGENIVLGDSKRPDGPLLSYTRAEWNAFVIGIKRGEFDTV